VRALAKKENLTLFTLRLYLTIRLSINYQIGKFQTLISLLKMQLSNEQILELLKSPKNRPGIQKAIDHEDHLRFHADIIHASVVNEKGVPVATIEDSPYYQKYLYWVQSFLTASDKFEQFRKMLTFPVKTNEVVDDIADEYMKVFDSQDSFFIPELSDPKLVEDYNKFLESIKDNTFWKEDAFKAMMSSISSILIVDLAIEQKTEAPEPYYYLLDIRQVHDVQLSHKEDKIEYIIFKSGKDNFTIFDDAAFRVYQKIKDSFILITENFHDLGYCPARFFWNDILSNKNKEVRHAPLSALLSRLDWMLFFETAKESLDLYGAYPIYWAYQSKCDYKDYLGNECQNGVIKYYDEDKKKDIVYPCPVCESKRIVGPGSLIEKPIPRGDIKLDNAPVGIVGIEKNSLDYNVSEVTRLKAQIITAATGKNKLIADQAINTDQVESQYESQTNVLKWIAENYAKAHKWVWDTVGKLRYGDNYLGSSVSYGTEFYLQNISDAIKDFQNSKNAGLPEYLLISKMRILENLQSKNNPKEKQRIEILRNLEPYPFRTLAECKNLGIDVIDNIGFVLKANFANFVCRFEREFGSIIEAGSVLDFSKRIELISQKLNEYANEFVSKNKINQQMQQTQTQIPQ
jgi:hypothetical protein